MQYINQLKESYKDLHNELQFENHVLSMDRKDALESNQRLEQMVELLKQENEKVKLENANLKSENLRTK